MKVLKEYLGFRANALHLREQRNNILGSNIANAATPNYKARDLDFEKILRAQAYELQYRFFAREGKVILGIEHE